MSIDETKRPGEETTSSPAAENTVEESPFETLLVPTVHEKKKKRGKLSKQTRTLLIALATVAALVAVLLLIPLLPDSAPLSSGEVSSAVDEETIPLIDKTIENDTKTLLVTKTVIRNKNGEYTLLHDSTEDLFRLVGFEDILLDSSMTKTMVTSAAKLEAFKQVAAVTSLADFGLDKPAVTANFTYHDGTTAQLLIGNLAPDKSSYYVKLADKNDVYLCEGSALNSFLLEKEDFVNTNIITAPIVRQDDDGNGRAILREISFKGKALPQPMTLRCVNNTDGEEFSYFNYIITKPYKRGTSDAAISALSSFVSLTADDAILLHPTKQQLKELGFNDPYVVADINLAIESSASTTSSDSSSTQEAEVIYYGGTDYTLTIAGKSEDGKYLVMVNGINAVFAVAEETLAPIAERTYDNTVSSLLFLKDIGSISRIKMTVGETVYDFALTHLEDETDNDKNMIVTYNDKKQDTPNFRSLYQLTMGLERYDAKAVTPSGKPELIITLYEKDGSEYLSAYLYPQSGSLHTARTTEGELFCVRSGYVTHFINQIQNYVNGKQVLVD